MIRTAFKRRPIYVAPIVMHRQGSSGKERKVFRLVASLDHFVVRLVLSLIALYILSYGFVIHDGPRLGAFSWQYCSIILPIWLVDGLKGLIETFMPSHYKSSDEDLSKVTVIVPSRNGSAALGRTLRDLTRRFEPHHIIVVSNGSTDSTVIIAKSYGVICIDIAASVGKVRAINYAIDQIETPLALLIDDDTLLGDAHVPTGLIEKDGFEAVAFRVLVNTSTWITKLQMYEYRKSTDIGKRFHNRKASVQNISGAIGLFNVSELRRQIQYHTNEFAGEDLQRTLLVHLSANNKGVVLTDSIVYTDPPATLGALFNQRTLGWFPGLYVNFTNYIRIIVRRKAPLALRYDAFHNVFFVMILDVLRLLSLPILFYRPWYFVVMYLTYISFEAVSYLRSGRKDPIWVVLIYPLYGLFGFITRICALCIFAYRRLVARIARTTHFDDYKTASSVIKAFTIIAVALIVQSVLLGYLLFTSTEIVNGFPTMLN